MDRLVVLLLLRLLEMSARIENEEEIRTDLDTGRPTLRRIDDGGMNGMHRRGRRRTSLLLFALIPLLISLIPLLLSLPLLLLLSLLQLANKLLRLIPSSVPLRHLSLLRHVRIVPRLVGVILLPLLPQLLLLRLRPICISIPSRRLRELRALDRFRESCRSGLRVRYIAEMEWSSDDGSERSRKRSGIRAFSAGVGLARIVRSGVLVLTSLLSVLLRMIRIDGGLRMLVLRMLRGLLELLSESRILLRVLSRIVVRALSLLSLHRASLLQSRVSSLRQHHVRRLRSRELLIESVQLI